MREREGTRGRALKLNFMRGGPNDCSHPARYCPGVFGMENLDEAVLQMFSLVSDAVAGATQVFLTPDREAARVLIDRDQLIDALHRRVENEVLNELIDPLHDDAKRRRRLLLILRILPELERSGDLAEHIASHSAHGLARWLTPRALSLVSQMGAVGFEMWQMTATAYAEADPTAADRLRALDDEVDDLHVSLTAELAAGGISIPVAIEMGLVARYFERLGDHAVNIARRLEQLGAAT